MEPLAINLAIIFGSRLLSVNTYELFIPYLVYNFKYSSRTDYEKEHLSRPEQEFLLIPIEQELAVMYDTSELVIQVKAMYSMCVCTSPSFYSCVH